MELYKDRFFSSFSIVWRTLWCYHLSHRWNKQHGLGSNLLTSPRVFGLYNWAHIQTPIWGSYLVINKLINDEKYIAFCDRKNYHENFNSVSKNNYCNCVRMSIQLFVISNIHYYIVLYNKNLMSVDMYILCKTRR